MAAPERFAESQICSCTAGTVHTWPEAAFVVRTDLVANGGKADTALPPSIGRS